MIKRKLEEKLPSGDVATKRVEQILYYSPQYLDKIRKECKENETAEFKQQLRKLELFNILYLCKDLGPITTNFLIEQLGELGVDCNQVYDLEINDENIYKPLGTNGEILLFEITEQDADALTYYSQKDIIGLDYLLSDPRLIFSDNIKNTIIKEKEKFDVLGKLIRLLANGDEEKIKAQYNKLKELGVNLDKITIEGKSWPYVLLDRFIYNNTRTENSIFPNIVQSHLLTSYFSPLNLNQKDENGNIFTYICKNTTLRNQLATDRITSTLLNLHVDTNIEDKDGNTALYYYLVADKFIRLRDYVKNGCGNNLVKEFLNKASYDNLIHVRNKLVSLKEQQDQKVKENINRFLLIIDNYLGKLNEAFEKTPLLLEIKTEIKSFFEKSNQQNKNAASKQIDNNISTSSSSSGEPYYNRYARLGLPKQISYATLPVDPSLSLDQDEEEKHLDPSSCCSSSRVTMSDNDNNKDDEEDKEERAKKYSSSSNTKDKDIKDI